MRSLIVRLRWMVSGLDGSLHTPFEGAGLFHATIAEFRSLTAWEKCVIYFIEYDSRFWHMLATLHTLQLC